MSNIKIKICDIRTVADAVLCAKNKVDFIGLHHIRGSIPEEKIELFNDIKKNVNNIGLVLVTKESNINMLISMCKQFKFNFVQLHFSIPINDLIVLEKNLKAISIGIIYVMETSKLDIIKINQIRPYIEMLLFDSSMKGGTGKLSSYAAIKNIGTMALDLPYFIAGGLNANNVNKAIKLANPFGVDVQSGVEFSDPAYKHLKDEKKLREFVRVVNSSSIGE